MKIGLIGLKGSFDTIDLSKTGTRSVDKTVSELYNVLRNLHKKELILDKIEFKRIKGIGPAFSIMLQSLFKNFEGYDILHNPDFRPFFPLRKGKAKTISTPYGLEFLFDPTRDFDRSLRGRLRNAIVMPLALHSLHISDYMIAISSLVKENIIKWGYDKDRIFLVNDFIGKEFITKEIKEKKARNKFIVGYLGTFRLRKNVSEAIKAFMLLKGDNYSFELWGKKSFEYENVLKQAESDNRIVFKGPAPSEKIVEIYDSFDVFVFPTHYEGFGKPILEAQARGLPVIIFKSAQIPKEVRKYCFEAESPEHMAQIIEELKENGYNEKERNEAMNYARSFTIERTAIETYKVYEKIASELSIF